MSLVIPVGPSGVAVEDGTTLAHDDRMDWTLPGGQPNNHPENGGDQDHLMMRHTDGRWNDRNGAEETHAVLERQPGWVTEENVSERQTDYVYRMNPVGSQRCSDRSCVSGLLKCV